MNENKRAMILNHAMTFGLVMGVVFSANFFLGTLNKGWASGLNMVLTCAIPYILYLVMKDCRDKVCGGEISYRDGVRYGVQVFFYGSLISGAFKYVYLRWLNPSYLEDLYNQSMQMMEMLKMKVTDEVVDSMRLMLTPLNMAGQYIWVDTLVGLFVALVVAAIVRRITPFGGLEKVKVDNENKD